MTKGNIELIKSLYLIIFDDFVWKTNIPQWLIWKEISWFD